MKKALRYCVSALRYFVLIQSNELTGMKQTDPIKPEMISSFDFFKNAKTFETISRW